MRSISMMAWLLSNLAIGRLYAGEQLGTGVVTMRGLSATTRIEFFSAPQGKKVKEVNFENSEHGQLIIKDLAAWLQPESYHPDDGTVYLFFRCLERKPGWLKVIVNNNSGESYWLPESSQTEYRDWISFLKGIGTISRRDHEKNPIRKEPNGKEVIQYGGDDCFHIRKAKGDWIEIFVPKEACRTVSPGELNSGWIKWRETSSLLVDYAYLGC